MVWSLWLREVAPGDRLVGDDDPCKQWPASPLSALAAEERHSRPLIDVRSRQRHEVRLGGAESEERRDECSVVMITDLPASVPFEVVDEVGQQGSPDNRDYLLENRGVSDAMSDVEGH